MQRSSPWIIGVAVLVLAVVIGFLLLSDQPAADRRLAPARRRAPPASRPSPRFAGRRSPRPALDRPVRRDRPQRRRGRRPADQHRRAHAGQPLRRSVGADAGVACRATPSTSRCRTARRTSGKINALYREQGIEALAGPWRRCTAADRRARRPRHGRLRRSRRRGGWRRRQSARAAGRPVVRSIWTPGRRSSTPRRRSATSARASTRTTAGWAASRRWWSH